jgi:PAS domain S-box-containing protein
MDSDSLLENEIDTIRKKFGVLGLLPVGAFVINKDFKVLFWNKCLAQWAGVNTELILGAPAQEYIPKMKSPGFSERLEQVFKGGPPLYFSSKIHKYIIPCKLPAGGYRDQQFTVSPVNGKDENTFYALFIIQDVTDHVKQISKYRSIKEDLLEKERKLQSLFQEVEKSNQRLEEFAYVVSHDLKAPLRSIGSLSSWIAEDIEGDIGDEVAGHINLMQQNVTHMTNMISGVLEYSKVGSNSSQPEKVKIVELLEETIGFLNPPDGISIEVKPNMPTLNIEKIKFQQVFQNLISNAIKYSNRPDGKISISCNETDGYFEFSVKDNGPGIDPEYHDSIFGLFKTIKSQDTKDSTGVGLAIVKRIVEEAGGAISVESSIGQGATFRVLWPKEMAPQNQVSS